MVLQNRELDAVALILHLNDDRYGRSKLRKRFGNSAITHRQFAMAHCRHPHLDVEVDGKLSESLDILQCGSLEIESLQNHTDGTEVSVLLQEVDRMAELVNRERLAGIRMKNAITLHFEPHSGWIFKPRRVGEVYENLVIELAQVIDSVVERRVQRFSSAHRFVE